MLRVDALHDARRRLDVETAGSANCDAANVGSGFLSGRNDGANHVAGLKAADAFLFREIAARKAIGIQARALICAASCCLDRERRNCPIRERFDRANAGRAKVRGFAPKITLPSLKFMESDQ